MKSLRVTSAVPLAVGAVSIAMTLASCGSGSDTASTSTAASVESSAESLAPAPTAAQASNCPTVTPERSGTPEWTLHGSSGTVTVTGSTETAAPRVDVDAPLSVTETQVHTLRAGDGPVVVPTATVSVCYLGVNGRDGSVFDSSYQRGAPVDFPLNRVVTGFQKAIVGQQVGATVGVAMTSADGYPEGQPGAGIQPGDTLIFAIKILDASN